MCQIKSPKSPKSISINGYLEKQLAESIANSSGVDSPESRNANKPFVMISPGPGAGSGTSHSNTSEDDSDEELYGKGIGSMDTETTAFTLKGDSMINMMSDINISGMSIIKDHDMNDVNDDSIDNPNNEGTPDEILNIDVNDIKGMDEQNDEMDGYESENETMTIPMNPVISI